MHRAALRLFLAAFVLALAPVYAAPAPLDYFAQLPTAKSVSLSPSGQYMAMVQVVDEKDVLSVYDMDSFKRISTIPADDPKAVSALHPEKRTRIGSVRWIDDNRMVVNAAVQKVVTYVGRNYLDSECRFLFINRDGGQPVSLACSLTSILSLKSLEPNTIMVQGLTIGKLEGSARGAGGKTGLHVFKVNALTGAVEVVEYGSSRTISWGTDRKGELRLRIDNVEGKPVFYTRAPGTKEWIEAGSSSFRAWARSDDPSKDFDLQAFGSQPNQIYIQYNKDGRYAVGLYDLTQKKVIETVFSDPKFDVGGMIADSDGNAVGFGIERWDYEQIFVDPKWQALQKEAQATFPGQSVRIFQVSKDLERMIVYVEGSQFPGGSFNFLNFKTGAGFNIVRLYPNLKDDMIGTTSIVTYTARDGTPIDAYLTLPRGSNGKNLPAIMMPHGGPHARDSGGFDDWTYFLANRGYAVIRPQFRGSRGFGVKHLEDGRFQWGLKMQDDVSDGVKYLISSGVADAERICIFGWSYGGYAAMAGATLTPELYRCVVAGAGVSDLLKMLQEESRGDPSNSGAEFWRKTIGNPGTDAAKLRAASPALLTDKIAAPVLLIHGDLDPIVPVNQSELFYEAGKKSNKPVEFVNLRYENHYLVNAPTKLEMFKALEGFVLKHNPPN